MIHNPSLSIFVSKAVTVLVLVALALCVIGSVQPVVASGPSFEGFTAPEELQGAIDQFMVWFHQEHKHHSQGALVEGGGVGAGGGSPRDARRSSKVPHAPIKVTLAYGGPSLRLGVFATETIASETPYLSIPHGMIIHRETIEATPAVGEDGRPDYTARGIGQLLKDLWGKVRAPELDNYQAMLGLFLLHQRFVAGPLGYFYHYIRLLPARHDTPEYYTDAELALLNGTTRYDKALWRRRKIRDQHKWLHRHIFDVYSDFFPPEAATYDNWRWVVGILDSRMIWWEGQPHLVPLLDMVNCQQLASRPSRVHSTFRRGEDAVTLAPITFRKGQQLFENYGQPNPTYYLYHGFVMEPNDKDCGEMNAFIGIPRGRGGKVARQFDNARGKLRTMRIDPSDLCVSARKMDDLLAVARVYKASASSASVRDAPVPMRSPYASPLQDAALERSAIIFAGKAVNATMAMLADSLARAALHEEAEAQRTASVADASHLAQPTSTSSSGFRLAMVRAYLRTQYAVLDGVRSQLRSMLRRSADKPPPATAAGRDEL